MLNIIMPCPLFFLIILLCQSKKKNNECRIQSNECVLIRTEKPYEKSLAILIEMYRTFLDTMPPTLKDIYLNVCEPFVSLHDDNDLLRIEFHARVGSLVRQSGISSQRDRPTPLQSSANDDQSCRSPLSPLPSPRPTPIFVCAENYTTSGVDPHIMSLLRKSCSSWFKYLFVGKRRSPSGCVTDGRDHRQDV